MRLDSNAVADDPLPTSVTHTSELTPLYEDIKNFYHQRRKLNFKHMDQFHSREINNLSACLYLSTVIL